MVMREILMGGRGGVLGKPIANRKPESVEKFANLLEPTLDIILVLTGGDRIANLARGHSE